MSAQAALGAAHGEVVAAEKQDDGLGNSSYGQVGSGDPSYGRDGSGDPSYEEVDTDVEQADEPTELATEETSQQEAAEIAEAEQEADEQQEAKEEGASHDVAAAASKLLQEAKEKAIGRIRQSRSLPPALRERLAALVEADGQTAGEDAADVLVRVPLGGLVRAVEASLPDFLRGGAGEADRIDHPAGDAFFRGDGELSDDAADQLARGQLARSGLLRGQRVRVAED